jgi:hypothetical protein
VAYRNCCRRHGRIDGTVKENSGGWYVTHVADCCSFVDVDREGCIEIEVVVGAVHVDGEAWSEGLCDCSVGDCGVGYS